MIFDIFLSICQTEVDGHIPNEKTMFENFFDQVKLADALGFGTAWLAETHLSCQIQKENPGAVIPHFQGEIGLNTDVLQMAHIIMAQTKRIHVGSAIRNILCNGGPIAHAEAIRTFLSLQSLQSYKNRKLELGFASGRFPFSNRPYGIRPLSKLDEVAWPVLSGKYFQIATEIFLRFLRGDIFSSKDLTPIYMKAADFRKPEDWVKTLTMAKELEHQHAIERVGQEPMIRVQSPWFFEKVGVIPFEAPLENLRLTIGAHWAEVQNFANTFLPVGVFNLSITPNEQIEETHQRMQKNYMATQEKWSRALMPRTVLVFVESDSNLPESINIQTARERAEKALANYWKAIEGTLDPMKVQKAVDNALVGTPKMIIEQMKERFHPDDRLMLWFDFNNHNNEQVKNSMKIFMNEIAPHLNSDTDTREATSALHRQLFS